MYTLIVVQLSIEVVLMTNSTETVTARCAWS